MAMAPVVDLDANRRRLICHRLHQLGVTVDEMRRVHEQHGDPGLTDLWTRERTLAGLKRLTGRDRRTYTGHSTDELVELERATLKQLMGAEGRTSDQLLYSIGGRQAAHPVTRRRHHLQAWGITA